jgi:wobble nucleotide-excising tRNase
MDRHNQQAQTFAQDQEDSRLALRRNEVAKFIADIDLAGIETRIQTLTTEEQNLRREEEQLSGQVRTIESELASLRLQLRDERKGADKVNEFLNHYFGHNALSLVAVDQTDGVSVRFEIRRGTEPAYNLSDGECSLVAFCYFIARLEDDSTAGKNLIIYIDDPISSLDSNHVFFVYSLIETLIAAPITNASGIKDNRYRQLFISTHNLDFLKFLKRMSRPETGGNEHFIVTRTSIGSTLEIMPAYLKQYVTEFHYLFDQIVCCAVEDPATSGHHCFFNFGNNMRKFFEIYLFFRYPWSDGSRDYNRRVEKYFEADLAVEPLANRITNELSHGGEALDRCMHPVDYEEIGKLAKFVMKKLRASDSEQYQALLNAVGKSDPLSTV